MEDMNSTWLVVHPKSMLMALEMVENGQSAIDVMTQVVDWAHDSMEEDTDDEHR